MGPMLVAMLVGGFFVVACVAAAVATFPVAYLVICAVRRKVHEFLFVLGTGCFFGFLSLGVGVVMLFNVIGCGIMQNCLLGCAAWFVIGFAGPAFAAAAACGIRELVCRRGSP